MIGALIRMRSLGSQSNAGLLLALAFFFFVISSAPHRVHHFFQETPLPHDQYVSALDRDDGAHETGHEHNRVPQAPATNSPECAVLSLAQNAHAFTAPLVALPFQAVACAHTGDLTGFSTVSFNPSPFSQRAPPLA